MDPAVRIARRRLLSSCAALALAFCVASPGFSQEPGTDATGPRVLLRMASDSNVVGHYKFTVLERQRLVFDLAADDPRVALLEPATVPKQTTTDVAVTIVSTPVAPDEDRRYLAYWLGYKVYGDDVQGLSSFQWDTIFQQVGRRVVLRFSPRGHPKGVEVTSDAVRPVAQSLADALAGLAMALPPDSVSRGSRWEDDVAIVLKAPDGSGLTVVIRVTYRLREIQVEPEGLVARIEFDGEPVHSSAAGARVLGRYFGDSRFAVNEGRYERMMALAKLEIEWEDTSGLPPSRSLVEWQGQFARR